FLFQKLPRLPQRQAPNIQPGQQIKIYLSSGPTGVTTRDAGLPSTSISKESPGPRVKRPSAGRSSAAFNSFVNVTPVRLVAAGKVIRLPTDLAREETRAACAGLREEPPAACFLLAQPSSPVIRIAPTQNHNM